MTGFEFWGRGKAACWDHRLQGLQGPPENCSLILSPLLACVLPPRREESPAIPRIPCVTPETVLIKPEEPEQVCVPLSGVGRSKTG